MDLGKSNAVVNDMTRVSLCNMYHRTRRKDTRDR